MPFLFVFVAVIISRGGAITRPTPTIVNSDACDGGAGIDSTNLRGWGGEGRSERMKWYLLSTCVVVEGLSQFFVAHIDTCV